MVDGVATGAFIPKAADSSSGFLIGSCLTPCSPRPHALALDLLLAPWYVLLHRLLRGHIEGKTLAIFGRQRGSPPRQSLLLWAGAVLAALCVWGAWHLARSDNA